jgi:hypothetical protein
MIMADVFKILFLILGMLICTVSYWLMFSALLGRTVARAQQALATRPWRTFFTGILAGAPLVLLGIAMASNGAAPVKLLGVMLLMALLTAALFGSTGLVWMVGRGLGNPQSPSHTGALVFRGGSVVSIAFVFPLVGWFLVLPAVLIVGFGAAIHVLRPRRSTPVQDGVIQV